MRSNLKAVGLACIILSFFGAVLASIGEDSPPAAAQSNQPGHLLAPASVLAGQQPLTPTPGASGNRPQGIIIITNTPTRTPTPISIGNFVWDDMDGDGRQDDGRHALRVSGKTDGGNTVGCRYMRSVGERTRWKIGSALFCLHENRPNGATTNLYIHDNIAPGKPLLGEVLAKDGRPLNVDRGGNLTGVWGWDGRRLSGLRSLVVDLDREAKVADHSPHFRGGRSRCREVAIDEH